jgi:ABC-type Fe3+ transport system substrate-binding protein
MKSFKSVGLLSALVLGLAQPALAQNADWQAGGGPEWQKVMAAAKQEGKVVIGGPAPISRAMSAGFEKDTGIAVEFIAGSPSDLAQRLQREAETGNATIDIGIGGGIEFMTMYLPGLLDPIKPRLILPGALKGENWVAGEPKWFDNQKAYLLQISNWVHGWAVINTDKVDVSQIKTWQDLLKPEFKGKIAANDPRRGGPGQSAAAYLMDQFGIDFVKKLYIGQEVTYTTDSRQLVDWAARGTYPIVLGAIQFEVERFKQAGMKQLAVPTLADGPGTLTGGFGVLKLPKKIPHPNAATVFLNWIASQPGQVAYAGSLLEAAGRKDAQIDAVPDYVRPKPGIKYLDQYAEDWYKNERPRIANTLLEALGGR